MSVGSESGFSSEEVLNVRYPLHRACRDGDIGALCSLLQHSANKTDLATEDSFYGWTPIHWAAHFGKLECVIRLVQVGSGINATTTRFAQTPTHIAAFGGHPNCLMWLLQGGADINRQDYVGETPIHKAARSGSMDCVNALLLQGAKAHLRNASGLTAADLAHAQGFQECAQLLSNVQNRLNQLNGFYSNGALSGVHQSTDSRVHFNGGPRKRSLEYLESHLVKKARTEGLNLPMKMYSGADEELEIMHTESEPPVNSGAPLAADVSHNGLPGKVMGNGFATNRHVPQPQLNGMEAESAENGLSIGFLNPGSGAENGSQAPDMCGSLHLGGSPSSCVSHRPSWAPANPYEREDPGDTLQYGHYHGFGDTAESIPEASSMAEHSSSVKVEQRYDNAVYSALHLFHGS
ncbi:ankyrin repeat domain-containing protein 10-like [Acipenser oxyrinchus oxyrinchus]|uniref:Ankyrin repeat domain-containing protein 10-like n=1 Tax=Acipenser oxyrinchus oxyrinchus TaxID=40147 RepID=A0AAD8DDZ5_ACIOX|nr:ankyrin repeat domain-containing protein 10-like [Acipenser oxyrinchus oxyrinchus]